MNIKITKLNDLAIIPAKATEGAAAYDVYTPTPFNVQLGRQIIPLGFAIELPKGYQAQIEPRSGFSSKGMEGQCYKQSEYFDTPKLTSKRFDADVIVGKIDSDYRGNVGVIINNRSGELFTIPAGTRIAQMTIQKVEDILFDEVDSLTPTERGVGGFGSTGY